MGEVLRYAIAGLINTAIGYAVFWMALRWAGFSPEAANALGYGIALSVAFVLNRVFVFEGARLTLPAALKFALSFLAAFGLNQAVLVYFVEGRALLPEIAQIFAMATYTVAFYLFNKHFVFSSRPKDAGQL